MERKAGNRRNSGQTLIITALVIALLVLSIVYGVLKPEEEVKRGLQPH